MADSFPFPVGPAAAEPRLSGMRSRHPRRVAMERLGASLLRRAESWIVVIGLVMFAGGFSDVLRRNWASTSADGENVILRAIYSAVYLLILPSVILRWRSVLASARRHWWTVALVVLALLSTQWSAAPDWTFRRSVALLATTGFGVFIAARYDPRSMLRILGAAFGLALVLSIAFALVLPQYGIEQSSVHTGAWVGIFTQKNQLGQMMVLGAVVFALLRGSLERGRWLATTGAVLCIALVLLSTSKTALTVLITLGALTMLFRMLRWHYTIAVPFLIGGVLVGGGTALVLLANLERVLTLMGKDPSLTGRTPMWNAVVSALLERPWLGYGYSAFWLPWDNSPSAPVIQALQWETPNAHNGFLDLALQLGILGLALFLIGFALAAVRALQAVRATRTPDALWPILFLCYLLLYNTTESLLAVQHHVLWVLYVATACSAVLAGRQGPAAPPKTARAGGPREETAARRTGTPGPGYAGIAGGAS